MPSPKKNKSPKKKNSPKRHPVAAVWPHGVVYAPKAPGPNFHKVPKGLGLYFKRLVGN